MKVTILDDYFDTLRTLPCFDRLQGHEVTVRTDHLSKGNALAQCLRDTEALVLFRKRTAVTAELLDRLPALRLISQRSVHDALVGVTAIGGGVTPLRRGSRAAGSRWNGSRGRRYQRDDAPGRPAARGSGAR